MRLTATDIDLLLEFRNRNPNIDRVAAIGNLSLYLRTSQVRRLQRIIPDSRALSEYSWGASAHSVLRDITGATQVASIDMSDYQGACIIHDINLPLWNSRPDLEGQFDLIIGGGTLEHVFNFPVAVLNLMFLARRGGHIFTANPANNLCSHGFCQFPPELMHRLYAPVNGFRIDHVLLTQSRHMSVEMDANPRSVRVADPASLGRRVLLRNHRPVLIRTLAERIGAEPATELDVQQSDYVTVWAGSSPQSAGIGLKALLSKAFELLQRVAQSRLADILMRSTLSNPQAMQRWRGRIAEWAGAFRFAVMRSIPIGRASA